MGTEKTINLEKQLQNTYYKQIREYPLSENNNE